MPRKAKAHVQFEAVMKKTFDEFLRDVGGSDDKWTPFRNMTGAEIIKHFKDKNSELCKAIPVETLKKSAAGRQYLDIFALVQPEFSQAAPTSKAVTPAVPSVPSLTATCGDTGPLSNNAALMNLVNDMMSDLQVSPMTDPRELDIVGLFTKIQTKIRDKIESGELDEQELQQQANDFMGQMKDIPEFQNVMSSPELMNVFFQQSSS